ncbi:flagellar motor protein MotD [Luteimonas sp. FCS-9]|uniref:flagellar motor protein MotD n=1 Tax=Luteimonas sp. FCS-9 TaxID=1547516 RepID=UPI00063EB776|nr:flagellar motor protein MotD [Luteimonas sp. FCS-9]KLJ02766.1 flagellar motor protein MotD [Luteimonas sp. FCS-9]
MARRRHHEEHANHEAWAIPYADLMTLLLAFFVVMYAVSSLNEGKYRVMASSLANAFSGTPRTLDPIQVGDNTYRDASLKEPVPIPSGARRGPGTSSPVLDSPLQPMLESKMRTDRIGDGAALDASRRQLARIALQLEDALSEMVQARLITVRRADLWLEVEINSDILFPSGSATLDFGAQALLGRLATILRGLPNPIRIEGYTDDRPIRTAQFPSNWELSAARAASVVHLFVREGLAPERLVMVGYGEQRPKADNASEAGRNANRRVVLMVLAEPESTEGRPIGAPAPARPVAADALPAVADERALPSLPPHPRGET